MALSVMSEKFCCSRCGKGFSTRKNFFPVSYCSLYKGTGYLHICKECLSNIYNSYYEQCGDVKKAVMQTCRKLDLYWNEQAYNYVEKKNSQRTMMSQYLQRINSTYYAGKSYDDTLIEQGMFWNDIDGIGKESPADSADNSIAQEDSYEQKYIVHEPEPIEITEDVVSFWGPGYTPEMYIELERRLQYYRSQMGDTQQDMGTDALLRQIVMLEIDINKARAEGRDVDKKMSTFNSLLSSLVKPMQKKEDMSSSVSNTPFGVWIKRWEDERPVPEIDDSLKDVDGIIKYILTWVYGHVAHMLKVKNANTALYDDAIKKYRVERPEYNDEEDEVMLYDIFKGSDEDDDETG